MSDEKIHFSGRGKRDSGDSDDEAAYGDSHAMNGAALIGHDGQCLTVQSQVVPADLSRARCIWQ